MHKESNQQKEDRMNKNTIIILFIILGIAIIAIARAVIGFIFHV